MIVLIAGMPRSGSTFSFNIARHILRARGRVHQEASEDVVATSERAGNADHVLIKAHHLTPQSLALGRHGAFRTICTVRRVEDAMASWFEAFELSEGVSIDVMRSWLKLYQQLRPAALSVPYVQIDRRPWLAAIQIARFLCPKAGLVEACIAARQFAKGRVKQQADALSEHGADVQNVGWSYFDRDTFYHRRHISTLRSRPAEERVSPELLAQIRKALATELIAAGLG